ncbi:MAG: hypothetical protein ACTSWY_06430 [Promethearchaeota archaeon]
MSEERLYKCPKCGALRNMIREVDDKTKPLMTGSSITTFYAKKLICGNCGHEWAKK